MKEQITILKHNKRYLNIIAAFLFGILIYNHRVFADIFVNNFMNFDMEVVDGLNLFETSGATLKTLDVLAEFNTGSISNGSFNVGTDDIVVDSTGEFLQLEHWGDNPPDISQIAWYDTDANSDNKYDFRYRQCFTVTNNESFDLIEYQIYQNFDTASLVSAGKMDPNGDDIRFVDSDGNLLDFVIHDDMNTVETKFWIQLDNLVANSSEEICMYYGYVGTGSPLNMSNIIDTFTYSTPQNIYYTVTNVNPSVDAEFGSYVDGNNVTYNSYSGTLNQYDTTVQGASNATNDHFSVTGPLSIAYDRDMTDAAVPISFAGTLFVYDAVRNNDAFEFYSPYATTPVRIYVANGGSWSLVTTVNVNAGTTVSVNQNITDNRAYRIESNSPILATHRASGNYDSFIMYPAEQTYQEDSGFYELWGVGSQSVRIAAYNPSGGSCNIDAYYTDINGSTFFNSYTLNFGNNYDVSINGGVGTEGLDASFHLISDCPFGAASVADSDGTEQQIFFPEQEFANIFLVPQDTQYISITTKEPGVVCNLYDDTGTLLETDTSTSAASPYPNRIYFPITNSTADIIRYTAGYYVECSDMVHAYFEYYQNGSINDETNFLSFPQARKNTQFPPTVEDLDLAIEEGLYFASGFDMDTTASDPIAAYEYYIDLSATTDVLTKVQWIELLSSNSANNNVDQIKVYYQTKASGDCSISTGYSAPVEITNTSEVLLSTSTNSSDPNNTVTTNNYEYVFNPSLSTNDCINVIFEMATGNEFYTPQLDFIEFTCGTVIELAGQMNNPTVNLQSDTSNQVTSLLNITTSNINITNAKCYIEFEDFTNLSNAVILKGDLYNSTTSVGPIAQFNYPPTTISPIAEIDFNAGEQLVFQLEHQLVSDVIEELDLVMNCRINNNTIILTRNFKIVLD